MTPIAGEPVQIDGWHFKVFWNTVRKDTFPTPPLTCPGTKQRGAHPSHPLTCQGTKQREAHPSPPLTCQGTCHCELPQLSFRTKRSNPRKRGNQRKDCFGTDVPCNDKKRRCHVMTKGEGTSQRQGRKSRVTSHMDTAHHIIDWERKRLLL